MAEKTKARISATKFANIFLDNTSTLRTALEKYVHFVPISLGVVSELLAPTLPKDMHESIFIGVYNKLSALYPYSDSVDINNIKSVVTNDKVQRLSGKKAIGIYKNGTLVGILTSNYGNASSLIVRAIQDEIGVDLAVGHVVGDIQVLESNRLGGRLWIKNNVSMRSPLSMKLAIIQELFMLADHVSNNNIDELISWYFVKDTESSYYFPKHNFIILRDAISSAGKVFTGDLGKLSGDTSKISKTAITNGFNSFYKTYFKQVNEKLKKAKDDLSAVEVTSYINEGLNKLSQVHLEYFNKVIDDSVITKDFIHSLAQLKIVFVLPQTKLFNSGQLAAIEKSIAREAVAFGISNAINYKGSPSLKDYVLDSIEETIINGTKKKPFKNSNKAVDGNLSSTKQKSIAINQVKQKIAKKHKSGPIRLRSVSGQFISVINIENLIRKMLTQTVVKNMERPNLRNQTGRFARSVELVKVSQRGQSVQAFLTYMKYPYQTFEPGFKQGYKGYDPRRLIDQSVREIATKLVKARLQTVFV